MKPKNLSNLEKTADRWFSYFIRLRYADDNGYVQCVTCGKSHHWKEMDCGHFRTRNKKVHRFNPDNCHAQCTYCNQYRSGEQYKHGLVVDKLHGLGMADYLTSTENVVGKRKREDFEFIIEQYKTLAKEEAKKRGITL